MEKMPQGKVCRRDVELSYILLVTPLSQRLHLFTSTEALLFQLIQLVF